MLRRSPARRLALRDLALTTVPFALLPLVVVVATGVPQGAADNPALPGDPTSGVDLGFAQAQACSRRCGFISPVLLLAGNGHVRRDLGVPRWLTPVLQQRARAVGYLEQDGLPPGAFDLTVISPVQPRQDPCASLRAPGPA